MKFDIVNTTARPMLYVTRKSGMDSDEIAGVMGEAFAAIGAFVGKKGITPAGPPIALYRDWDGKAMEVDVGFPVKAEDATSAEPEINAGETPSGRALKTVHRGSYMSLRDTYGAMEAHIRREGLKTRDIAWEVYVSDPDTTPEAELLTEIYMPLV